jgi:2-polyprenyl-6-methoxyphenol hydroxylase-like FAD-dependent oxidoreductase
LTINQAKRRALIVGGGIGGLASALALRRAGCHVVVFERASELHEVGAGLALWSGTVALLRQLGVADEVIVSGGRLERSCMLTWRGDARSDLAVAEVVPDGLEPSVCIHRADLHATLLRALPPEVVRVNARCVGFGQDESGVTIRLADGREEHGDLLIGADGLHSIVRAQLVGESSPRYAGYTCWRGIAPLDRPDVRGTLSESWGQGARFGTGDIGRGRVLWFATANAPEGALEPTGERKRRLLERFGNWHAAVGAALEATPEAEIIRNDIYDRQPIQRWGEGRVTLLGDAAHPTTPNLGMGACMAIEDALVVAAKLQETADVPTGLRAYEDYRRDRTARIVRLSRQFGWVAQWQNPLLCSLRDLALRLTPASVTRDQLRQVVSYQVLGAGG